MIWRLWKRLHISLFNFRNLDFSQLVFYHLGLGFLFPNDHTTVDALEDNMVPNFMFQLWPAFVIMFDFLLPPEGIDCLPNKLLK